MTPGTERAARAAMRLVAVVAVAAVPPRQAQAQTTDQTHAMAAARPAAAEADGDGGIDSVVVFADRARVTRVRGGRCEHGTARLVFDPLPATLDARTLRGDLGGGARGKAEVVGVASELVNDDQRAAPAADPRGAGAAAGGRARELAAALRKNDADIRAREASWIAAGDELESLDAYTRVLAATLTEEIRNPAPATTTWTRNLDSLRAQRATLDERRRKLGRELATMRLERARLQRQIAAAGGARDGGGSASGARAHRTAVLTVDCRGLPAVTGTISYVVGGAGWQPEYDLDFTPSGRGKTGPGTIRLTVGAAIRQSTGEDWPDARILLSTARPKLGSEAPVPAPLVVGGGEEERGKVLVQAEEERRQLAPGDSGGKHKAKPAGPVGAALDDKGNAFVLTLPRRVSLPADGRPLWAPIDVVSAPASVKLVAIPKLDEHVYQVVALANPAAYPLLQGRVRSYRSGSFIGSSDLAHRGVGERFEVSLGIDDELKVERKTVDDRDRDPGLLSSTRHLVRLYRTSFVSQSATAETVELRENLPVSKIADVQVELLAAKTTAGYTLDGATGLLSWPVPLAPGERKHLDLGYAIHLPASWTVPGR